MSAVVALTPEPVARGEGDGGLALVNLHMGSAELAGHLVGCVERGDMLNAFLLAAGITQIAEDVLECDRLRLSDAHRVLAGAGHELAARGAALAGSALARLPREALAVRAHAEAAAALTDLLAQLVVAEGPAPSERASLAGRARAIRDDLPSVAALQAGVLRLPACFRGFDQHPDDIARLVDALTAVRPDRNAPLAVVGVRTSGSYLAPLAAAHLRARGYAHAFALTARPSHPLDAPKRRRLRDLIRARGALVVTDDPPASGDSVLRVIRDLEALGAPLHSTIPMFAMHAGGAVPRMLDDYDCVTLPWERWSIHRRLAPDAVAASLSRIWPGERVASVERLSLGDEHGRGHVAARFRVTPAGAATAPRTLFVRGAGLGFFGEHAVAVAAALDGRLPALHGVDAGLAFRDWIPDGERSAPSAADVAGYAAERSRALAVERDTSVALAGQDPVWEVASNILSRAFARGWRPLRVTALDALARELLAVERPSVIDSRMHPGNWFAGPLGPLKAKADEGAFSNRNLSCFDAAYDVAAAAVLGELDAEELRAEYARASGEWIDGERWLVYQLVAAWSARRDGHIGKSEERHRSARALRRYLGSLYLDGVARGHGEFCALDVDGVLETETLGFPGPSPAGSLALRTLLAHGYRPLLATGRSIGEVRARCLDYGLAGGVAEYGAAVFRSEPGDVRVLVSELGAAAVARARDALAGRPGVELGTDHVHTIRASRRDSRGRLGPLGEADLRAALAAAGPGALRAVPGECQTDLVPAEVDKARGLEALVALLGEPGAPIALAVGDAVEDLPMLRAARLGIAPANADALVRRSGERLARRGYQRGLAEAVGELVGHEPGSCPTCAPRRATRRTTLLGSVLAARESGPAGLAAQALRTTRLVRGRRAIR